MLFDIGWPELMLIGVIALVVIGPKDLPRALRVAGFWVRKARTLSREFQSSIDQMIRDAELDEMRQQLKKATEFDIEKEFQKTVDPKGELAESIRPPSIPDYFDSPAPSPAAGSEGTTSEIAATEAVPAETVAGEAAAGALPPPSGETPLGALIPEANAPAANEPAANEPAGAVPERHSEAAASARAAAPEPPKT